jgi:hypothetical protein
MKILIYFLTQKDNIVISLHRLMTHNPPPNRHPLSLLHYRQA